MENYTTASNFSDLNGSMTATDGIVDSYTSNGRGEGTFEPGSEVTDFKVHFDGVHHPYHITCKANGNGGFDGHAKHRDSIDTEETWTATATTAESSGKPATVAQRY